MYSAGFIPYTSFRWVRTKERNGNTPSARGRIISSLHCGSVSIASPQQIPRAMSVCPASATSWLHGNLACSRSQEATQTFSDVTSGVCVFTVVAGSGQSKPQLCCFFRAPEHRSEPLTSVSNFSIAVFFFCTVRLCEGTWTPVWRLNPRRETISAKRNICLPVKVVFSCECVLVWNSEDITRFFLTVCWLWFDQFYTECLPWKEKLSLLYMCSVHHDCPLTFCAVLVSEQLVE